MPLLDACITSPPNIASSDIQFSVWGIDWGYHAFLLSKELILEQEDESDGAQSRLQWAFELHKSRILQSLEQRDFSASGRCIRIEAGDLACDPKGAAL
ncbi:TPA: hypothetical protein QDB01_005167 [Burkholderia vietnamiensis]|nr:hypothetical protein [Burkholderia vietnamiensis]